MFIGVRDFYNQLINIGLRNVRPIEKKENPPLRPFVKGGNSLLRSPPLRKGEIPHFCFGVEAGIFW
jgi:hypothetical protein